LNDRAREFFERSQPDRSRVQYPEDVVFLCGGALGKSARSVKSMRDFIYRNRSEICAEKSVILAERAAERFDSRVFGNLIELERHIASISRIILLVCESAGSIAELGAFSMVEEIAARLLVIVHDEHYQANSFIRDGPLRFLESENERSVQQFRWLEKSRVSIDVESAELIKVPMSAAVKNFGRSQFRQEAFDADRVGHKILLVAGIVAYTRCCKIREITEYANIFGVELSQSEANKYLFCLEIFEWVKSVKRDTYYYYYNRPEMPFLFRGLDSRGSFDPVRVRHDIAQAYDDDDPRLNVIAESVAR